MRLTSFSPMLRTTNIEETLRFYGVLLGFKCDNRSDDGWASLIRDEINLMFIFSNELGPQQKPNFTGSLYFRTDDVDALWESLREVAKVCYSLENFHYGMREFAIYDNNGYLLQFGQPLGPE